MEISDGSAGGDAGVEGPAAKKTGMGKALTALTGLLTLLNAGVGYWGFSNAREISQFREEGQKSSANAQKSSEQAQKSSEAIIKIERLTYGYALKEIERDTIRIVRELPGLEFADPRSKALKDELRSDLHNADELRQDLPESTVASATESSTRFLAMAILKFDDRDFQGCISDLVKVTEPTPEKFYIMGSAYLRLNDERRARLMYQKMRELVRIKSDPFVAMSDVGEGAVLMQQQHYVDAIAYFKAASSADPQSFRPYYELAAAYYRMRQYKEAIAALCQFNKLANADVFREIETDPDNDFDNILHYLGGSRDQRRGNLESRLAYCK